MNEDVKKLTSKLSRRKCQEAQRWICTKLQVKLLNMGREVYFANSTANKLFKFNLEKFRIHPWLFTHHAEAIDWPMDVRYILVLTYMNLQLETV